ncbi:MAG: aminoacetone oxidase family FAD-binding enzyme, partial [Clostridia bacterium]|nr:aminoacetone oxidase family FAD-binding enzyme [Clostridia bacterium]
MNYDVVIIGGGASGLACAVRLIRQNEKLNIAIVEAGERLGKKLASTGNGQGNVTNKNMSGDYYFSGNKNIVDKIALSSDRIYLEDELFHCILQVDALGRVYPVGKQASALVDSLMYELRDRVKIYLNTKATDIDKNLNITFSLGEKITAKYIVMCVGGKAQKQFKTDGSAYALVQKFGHKLTGIFPSLVQLKTDTQHIKNLKGIRVDCKVSAFSEGHAIAQTHGDVIFTDYGVSGNAIFAISPYIADKPNVTLSLNFLQHDDETIIRDIEDKKKIGYPDTELLSGTLHNQLGRAIIKRCSSNDSKMICNMAKNFTLNVVGTLGFDYAQVTRGGIDMGGVTDELESKYVKNLFFAGEILDVDGCCGGYNLHWAFASG